MGFIGGSIGRFCQDTSVLINGRPHSYGCVLVQGRFLSYQFGHLGSIEVIDAIGRGGQLFARRLGSYEISDLYGAIYGLLVYC